MQLSFHAHQRRLGAALVAVLAVLVWLGVSIGATATAAGSNAVKHPSITSKAWGTANGQPVRLWTLRSGHGMTVRITNYGAVVQSIFAPGRRGSVANVALGFPRLSDYVNDFQNQPWPTAGGSGDTYFGAAVGRYANRIAGHSFTLNGQTYNLVGNNGPNNINTLHGGPNAWNTKVWSASAQANRSGVSLILRDVEPDGYNGFPGQVTVTVTYRVTSGNALRVHWTATTTKPTVINVTQHTYFNLAGEASGPVYDQLLKLNSRTFTPTDATLIPTGQFVPVAGTPFDFRRLHPIGKNILRANLPWGGQLTTAHGYDHNWVIKGRAGKMKLAAVAIDPASGREVITYTTEPGIQIYTGNFLVGDLVGTSGHIYRQTSAFTLETQHYPDSPHHIGQPGWPSVVLNPGHTFNSTTIYQFAVARR
jgi:aldose 1-epimerase